KLVSRYRQEGINNINDLVDRAMVNPDLAQELLSQTARTQTRTRGAFGYPAYETSQATQQQSPRAAGGTVPAVRPTGRRPAGKGASVQSRPIREGPRQIIPYG